MPMTAPLGSAEVQHQTMRRRSLRPTMWSSMRHLKQVRPHRLPRPGCAMALAPHRHEHGSP
eukprot:6314365-Alexandrium_andersonii.AAC.1